MAGLLSRGWLRWTLDGPVPWKLQCQGLRLWPLPTCVSPPAGHFLKHPSSFSLVHGHPPPGRSLLLCRSAGARGHLLQWIPARCAGCPLHPDFIRDAVIAGTVCSCRPESLAQHGGIVFLIHHNLTSSCSCICLLVFFFFLHGSTHWAATSTTVRIVLVLHSPLRPANSLRTVGAQCVCWVNRTQSPRQVMVVPLNFCQSIELPSLTFLICKMEFINRQQNTMQA